MKIQQIVALALMAGIGVAQVGNVKLSQKPLTLSAGAKVQIPNLKSTRLVTLAPAAALKLAADAGQKVQSLQLTATVTPEHPRDDASGLMVAATNVAMVVPTSNGNWVFSNQSGGFLLSCNVPSGSKFAIVSVAGLCDVNAKGISISSGASKSNLEFGADSGKSFNKSALVDVQGIGSFGGTIWTDLGVSGTVWVSNVSVQFLK